MCTCNRIHPRTHERIFGGRIRYWLTENISFNLAICTFAIITHSCNCYLGTKTCNGKLSSQEIEKFNPSMSLVPLLIGHLLYILPFYIKLKHWHKCCWSKSLAWNKYVVLSDHLNWPLDNGQNSEYLLQTSIM